MVDAPRRRTSASETLRALYCDQHLTQAEIGRIIGVSQTQAGRLLRKAGVPTQLKSDRLDLPELTSTQHEILVGSLLGDGSIGVTGTHTARFSEGHSQKQEGYLRWKADVLRPFTTTIFPTSKTAEVGSGRRCSSW